jgi:hypothetical protein
MGATNSSCGDISLSFFVYYRIEKGKEPRRAGERESWNILTHEQVNEHHMHALTVNPSSRHRPHTRPQPTYIEPRSSRTNSCRSRKFTQTTTTRGCSDPTPSNADHRHQATRPCIISRVVSRQQRVRQPTCPRTLPDDRERGRARSHTRGMTT